MRLKIFCETKKMSYLCKTNNTYEEKLPKL
jgi:hypothetical protein